MTSQYTSPLFTDVWTFWVAVLLNMFFGLSRYSVVGWCIGRLIRRSAQEICDLPEIKSLGVDVNAEETALDLFSRTMLGATIGVLERVLYIYALTVSVAPLLAGVITLKAFSAWVQRENATPADRSDQSSKDALPPSAHQEFHHSALRYLPQRIRDLSRWYAYTIGNLVSLSFAIALFS